MPTLSQLRRRVDALKRKYARELAVVRLRRLAEEHSLQWTYATNQGRPLPQPQPFIRRIAKSGYRLKTFVALDIYLERCREEGKIPDSLGIISKLLPQIPFDRLRKMLRWEAPARELRLLFPDQYAITASAGTISLGSVRLLKCNSPDSYPVPRAIAS